MAKRSNEADGSEDDTSSDADSKQRDEEIIAEARQRFKLAEEAESDIRAAALEDLEFRAGKQWPDGVQADRQRDGRPCLVINRIPQFIQQIVNDQRQNRPSIKVHPVDDRADPETAKVLSGMIRHIEYKSNADVAYDTGFDSAVTSGLGYWRVLTEYCDPLSFDQEIRIKRIRNPFAVYFDPHSQEPDGSDADWAMVVDDMSAEDYKAKYPNSELANHDNTWDAVGNSLPGWVTDKSARVAEYFYREWKQETLILLSNGQTVLKRELPKVPGALGVDQATGQPITVVPGKERQSAVPTIHWLTINGIEILDRTIWPGKWIPIIPMYGTELYIDGKRILEGIVRHAKDPQRMHNYWSSAETETIALAPRAPFIAAEGQIKGHEKDWAEANRRNISVLQYKPTALNGQPVPPPTRNVFEPAVQAITQAKLYSAEDLKATTGIYDAALGHRSNETSGIAIRNRAAQAQTSNFHFTDNLTRSQKHTGRILVDLIPKIYDAARTARIIGDDGEQKIIKINQPFEEKGQVVNYKLDAGQYDVTIDVGPSYATKRQEAAANMIELSKAIPVLGQVAADLIVKTQDWEGAKEIADRLKKTLPPGIADDPNSEKKPLPPEIQQQLMQQTELIEKLTGELNGAAEEIKVKKIELESRERIEMAKIQRDIELKLAELDSANSLALLRAEIGQIEQRLNLLNQHQPIDMGSGEPTQAPQAPEQDQMMAQEMGGGAPEELPPLEIEGPIPTGGMSPGSPMEPMQP